MKGRAQTRAQSRAKAADRPPAGADGGADAAGPGAGPDALATESPLRRHLVLALVAAAYLIIFPFFRALENPNENVRVWATRALVQHGSWNITPVVQAWGPVTDTAAYAGQRYSSKAPGTSLLGVPVHFVHERLAQLFTGHSPSQAQTTWVLRIFTVIGPLLAFLLLFARRVEQETGSAFARDLLTLALGLGTMFYPYGLAFVGHAQSAALACAGLFALVPPRGAAPSDRRLLLAGGLVGLSVCFEYQTLFAAVMLAGFALWSQRQRAWLFLAGALIPAALLGAYHAALFGRPWELPYAHLDDPGYATYHHSRGFLGLGQPRARVLRAGFLSVDYGLFVFSPVLAAGFVMALWAAIRRGNRLAALAAAITAVMAVFLAGMTNWRGGWCAAGPRYIAVVVPFLVFAIALCWKEMVTPRRWLAALLLALTLISVALCSLAGLFPHFPVQLDNPVFDLVLPLLGHGYVPHGLGTALGLRGLPALLPWIAVVLAAVVLVIRAAGLGWRQTGAALLLAGVLLGALAGYGKDTMEDQRVRQFVEGIWEPNMPKFPAGGGERGPA